MLQQGVAGAGGGKTEVRGRWSGIGSRQRQSSPACARHGGGPNHADGAGVDPQTCQPAGPGADQLCAVWRDPSFDPGRAAVYYARIVENPSCRWSTRRCLALPAAERPDGCNAPGIPKTIQERAWTSPIWVEPRS